MEPVLETKPVVNITMLKILEKMKHTLKYMKIYTFDIVNINSTLHAKHV